jgi:transposase
MFSWFRTLSQFRHLHVQLLNKINSPITAIPRIGPINGATIFGEIGDISRFSIPAKPLAYAGIEPSDNAFCFGY